MAVSNLVRASILISNFCTWVVGEILDEDSWELNKDSFPEIACRKLETLGFVTTDVHGYWISTSDYYEMSDFEWVPCSYAKNPEETGDYLITSDDGYVFVATYYTDTGSWYSHGSKQNPVAWMRLPRPYEE